MFLVQVIRARDISDSVRTFGFSLSGGMDLDRNEYPDLLVGAYESGHAVHLRSAPVLQMDARVNFRAQSKQIDLDVKRCTLSDRKTKVPCVDVEVNMKYEGVGVPERIGEKTMIIRICRFVKANQLQYYY